MQKNIPLIGVSVSAMETGINMSPAQKINMISDAFLQIVEDYNCVPIMLPNQIHPEYADVVMSNLSGLILTSGPDISPSFYNEIPQVTYSIDVDFIGDYNKRNKKLSPNISRDKLELAFYHSAKKKKIPIMGICRGMQIINVAEGGTLFQELSNKSFNHFLEKSGWINYHNITIDTQTLSGRLLGQDKVFVSSIHHQGINRLGDALHCVAKADDGIIEVIEANNTDNFIIGIQSHVEMTRQTVPCFENVFSYFFQQAFKTIREEIYV